MIYLYIIRYGFLRYLAYPVKIFSTIFRNIVDVVFLLILWTAILPVGDELKTLAAYFFISNALGTITMGGNPRLGRVVRHTIKNGGITSYLTRPVKIIPYLYSDVIGKFGIEMFAAVLMLIIGILLSGNLTIERLVLFLIFLVPAMIIGFVQNLFEGALSFIFTETTGFKNAMSHIIRMLSGLFVPLYYFPEALKSLVYLTPFPWIIFGPANIFIEEDNSQLLQGIVTSYIWAIILLILVILFWRKVIKKYEAIGL